MKAESPCDVGEFLLLQTGFHNGSVTTGVRNTFWFPDKSVGAGDFVVVYTKRGTASERDYKDVKSHFFYWGLSESVWDKKNTRPVLMHAPVWKSFESE
jgi:hypothetical protein